MPLSKEKMRIYMKQRRVAKQLEKANARKFKPGTVPKDTDILDKFNEIKENNLSKKDEKTAKSQVAETELALLGGDLSSYKMLQDMRWIYKTMSGRRKLKELMKSDDKQFVSMIKELIKMESALIAAKIKKDGSILGGNGEQSFFVILKGLHDTPSGVAVPGESSGIDHHQLERAINPNSDLVPAEDEPEPDHPPEIVRAADVMAQVMADNETEEGAQNVEELDGTTEG
jgi:hypothetical protein